MEFLGIFLRVAFWLLVVVASVGSINVTLEDDWDIMLPEGYEWAGYLSTYLLMCLWIAVIIYYVSKWAEAVLS